MSDFLSRLAEGPLLTDGAMATLLHTRGLGLDRCFEALNLSLPAVVADVHRAYLDAGAELILTNSFGANRYKLRAVGLDASVAEINAAAVAVAQRAAAAAYREVLIAGDVGPLGVRLAPYGRIQPADAAAALGEQMTALNAAGVDLLFIETVSDLREATLAVRTARERVPLPIIATMTFTRDDRTLLGDDPRAVAVELLAAGADVVGINCAGGPAQTMRILRAMQAAAPSGRFAVKPNGGWPELRGDRIMYPATPAYFAEYTAAFADAGAVVIGGCCGTTPEHIAAMRAALAARSPQPAPMPAATDDARKTAVRHTPTAPRPTQLAAKLAGGAFIIGVEMHPPRGLSTHKLLAGAQAVAAAGADVINVADSPMARMRMSAWAVCHLIERETGLETVLHFPLRGRNVLRVQGDLLAAHALGLRNLFVVMGDPTAIGDYPQAMDASDLVPSGLIRLVTHSLNAGRDHAGADIGEPTSFFAGCAVNLTAADAEREIRGLRRKIAAGAGFALTQPVFDVAPARAFLDRYAELHGPLALPLLVGVMPLYNARHASFLHNEVPGLSIPAALRQRMAAAADGPAEGVRIALELFEQVRTVAGGVYLMPPFGRYDLAAEIIEHVRK